MDKTALRTALLALEGQELQAARQAYADYLAAAKPEEDLQDDAESHSLNVQDAELAEGLDAPLHSAEDAMARLQAIDFGPKSTVAPGAVLKIGGQYFVVAVATRPFKADGVKLMGISTDSPLYQAAQGKSAGESAQWAGHRHHIDHIE